MNELETFLQKIVQEKEVERTRLLAEAEKKRKEIITQIEKEIQARLEEEFARRRELLLRQKEESIFQAKQEVRKQLLEEKERIIQLAMEKVKEFLKKNPEKLPFRTVITPQGEIKEKVSPEEFLSFLREKYAKEIEGFFR